MTNKSREIVRREILHGKMAYKFQWNIGTHESLGNEEGDLASLWAHLSVIRTGKLPPEPFTSPFYTRASSLTLTKMPSYRLVAFRKRLIKADKLIQSVDDDLVHRLREYHRARNDTSYCADHGILQQYLQDDPVSIAVEVPVWSDRYHLSGHIDLVRFNDGLIQVCDYKPGKMDTISKRFMESIPQVAAYGEMMVHHLASTFHSTFELSLLPKVECCIFDTHSCWRFGAEMFVTLVASNLIEGI